MRKPLLWVLLLGVLWACHSLRPSAAPHAPAVAGAGDVALSDHAPGFRFRISDGAAPEPARGWPVGVGVTELGATQTQAILARLPKLDAANRASFALREASTPPPRAGKTLLPTFPPPSSSGQPQAAVKAALEVVRHAPDGEVPLAPHVSVTFSQPMVAVSAHSELARASQPLVLEPAVAGRFRWLGTQTLLFEPQGGRFPMATDYVAKVPAQTRALGGAQLPAALQFRFATAAPVVEQFHPRGGPVRRDALMFALFDQRIEPAAVLASIKLQPSAPLRLASPDEWKLDADVRALCEAAEANGKHGRYLVFRTTEPLPTDTEVRVAVGPGTPSAEGPRTTQASETFSFRTYGALKVASSNCGADAECTPGDPLVVEWSNPIDAKRFDKRLVRVTPELAGLKLSTYAGSTTLRGFTEGRTTYRVTFAAEVADVYGQTLGREQTVEFRVGPAPRSLSAQAGPMVVLDPAAQGRFSVFSVNQPALKLRLYAVQPEDYRAFAAYLQRSSRDDRTLEPPGKKVIDSVVAVNGAADRMVETAIDLAPGLVQGFGHVIVQVEPRDPPPSDRPWERQRIETWVQVTSIGLSAFVDAAALVAWASALKDGSPLAGVELSLGREQASVQSAADGLAKLPLGGTRAPMLLARRGADTAFLPEQSAYGFEGSGFVKVAARDRLAWYVVSDRNLYRPGERVSFKGWLRRIGAGPLGDVSALASAGGLLDYTVRDAQGNETRKGTAPLKGLGGFAFSVELPKTMQLGRASLELRLHGAAEGDESELSFEVQEFRRPEFEVSAQPSPGPYFAGDHATVTVEAKYYAGGPLPSAPTQWTVSASPAQFTPPSRDDYTFGIWRPFWLPFGAASSFRRGAFIGGKFGPPGPGGGDGWGDEQSQAARTDANGRHHLRVDMLGVSPPQPAQVHAEASVTDVNRQAWAASVNLLVHPAAHYVGLRSERYFTQPGEALPLAVIVTDLDGQLVAGRPVQVRAARLEAEQVGSEWKEREVFAEDCALTSAAEPVHCTFHPKQGGMYRITANVRDEQGRPNMTQITRWVAGGAQPPARDVQQERVTLVPSQHTYAPGEQAELLVIAPFAPAEGVLTLRRSGLVKTERFRMQGLSQTLRVPIDAAYIPNLRVQVDLVGAAPRVDAAGDRDVKLPARPAYASGELDLAVPPRERTLALTVTPRDRALEPGGATTIDVQVRDVHGEPVKGAEVAVIVVDEAVLALSDDRIVDPLTSFYPARDAGVSDYHSRAQLVLTAPVPALSGSGTGAGALGPKHARVALAAHAPVMADDAVSAHTPIKLRSDFDALALFAPALVSDAQGHVAVPIKLPGNLTRYRITALAAEGARRFGSGESALTARLPLMVRASAPRFLNIGDRFELPVVVQNQTGDALQVDVAVRASNAEPLAGIGKRVTVAPNDRVELRFPAAPQLPGSARFQFGAAAGRFSDAAEVTLPVWTPATTEAFAAYGTLDEGVVTQAIAAPAAAWPEFGGLELTTSSTAVSALTDAVLYLTRYPFECAEQLASRVVSIAALKDVLAAFHAQGLPPGAQLLATVRRDLDTLRAMQNDDGGFGVFGRGEPSWPWVTIHVTHALVRAQQKGFPVSSESLARARRYLEDIEQRIPAWYSAEARQTTIAYALAVRKRLGDRDAVHARALLAQAGGAAKLNLEALGFVYATLSGDAASEPELAAIRTQLRNRVEESAGTAHFTTHYSDGAHVLLQSDRRTDAILLEALIADQPSSDLIPKLAAGLLAHRSAGRWENTQESAFVLLALDRYFATYERLTPDFVARTWLGSGFVGEHHYAGRTSEHQELDVPMAYLAGKSEQALVLQKQGRGRLYYRVGMRYAPRELALAAADQGFTVARGYEALDKPGDVRRDADGTWHIRAGAKLRVHLTLLAPSRRYHVALVDPLPAGLEALNPVLAATTHSDAMQSEASPLERRPFWFWRLPWYEHENLRDDRVEAFSARVWEGVYQYTYVARATTPGTFAVPPARVEEIYHPETFGRSASDRVVIE